MGERSPRRQEPQRWMNVEVDLYDEHAADLVLVRSYVGGTYADALTASVRHLADVLRRG
jgi:hypothetical protein